MKSKVVMNEKEIAKEFGSSRISSIAERVAAKYWEIGHNTGDIVWWVDNSGQVAHEVFDGVRGHHELNRRMDMDRRWRGRIDKSGTATLMPPLNLFNRFDAEDMPVPSDVVDHLRSMGARRFLMDTTKGMFRVAFNRSKGEMR